MAVAVQATASGYESNVQNTIDVSFNPGTGDNMVILAYHYVMRGVGYTSGSVVRDPATDNQAFTQSYDTGDASFPNAQPYSAKIYILKDADIDKGVSQTYRGTSAGGTTRHMLFLVSLTGVDQTTSLSSFETDAGSSAPTVTPTFGGVGTSDGVFVDFWANDGSGGSVPIPTGTGQTIISTAQYNSNNTTHGAASYIVGDTTPVFTWDHQSGTEDWEWIGVDVLAAASTRFPYESIKQQRRDMKVLLTR